MGLQEGEVDRFLNLLDIMKRNQKFNLHKTSGPKKMLVLKFISGPLDK